MMFVVSCLCFVGWSVRLCISFFMLSDNEVFFNYSIMEESDR